MEGFEIRVALRLLQPDRTMPAVLRGFDLLVVPIRTFDETDSETRPALARPIDQVPQVALGVTQVSLDDNAAVRPVLELSLGKERLEESRVALYASSSPCRN